MLSVHTTKELEVMCERISHFYIYEMTSFVLKETIFNFTGREKKSRVS